MQKVVVDTNVFVSALLKKDSAPRHVLRHCLEGLAQPLMSNALFQEYEDVMARPSILRGCVLSEPERDELLNAFLSTCQWVSVYYLWRPNLPDEGDNHLVELAIAGNASRLITGNKKDFRSGELRLDDFKVVTPREYLKERN